MRQRTTVLVLGVLLGWTQLQAGTIKFEVDKNHSTIGFAVNIAAGFSKVRGQFTDYTVSIILDEDNLANSSVEVVIQVSSVDTGIPGRDADLQGKTFFDAANYSEITFRSSSIEVTEDGYRAIGDFTMKGVTTTVALPFIIIGLDRLTEEKPVIGISAQISLNRLDYGVGNDFIHRTIPQFLGPKVEIEIDMWTRPGKYQP